MSPDPATSEAVLSTQTDPLPEEAKRSAAYPSARYLSSWPQHSPFCCITMGMHCNCILPVEGPEPICETGLEPID